MLNIASILNFIATQVQRDPERFSIIDDKHLLDVKTGVKLHLYDDYFKLTHDNDILATKGDFTEQEQKTVWQIKENISDPMVIEERNNNYQHELAERREKLAAMFENPKPTLDTSPTPEANTVEYLG